MKGWQYGGGVFPTDDGDAGTKNRYYAIHIRIVYDDQCNAAWFDGVQLTKDEGETYVYDQDGNLTDMKSAAEQSKFRYDGNGNLSGMVSPDGTDFSYTYDSRNNLTEAENSDGAVYRFSYDAGGNRTEERIYPYTTGTLGEPETTISYGYGAEGWKDQLTEYDGQTITYDAIGNPLS